MKIETFKNKLIFNKNKNNLISVKKVNQNKNTKKIINSFNLRYRF
jgi:hypothetical protein